MWNKKDFLRQKPAVIKYFKKKGVDVNTIPEYCVISGIPIVVTCEFIKEDMPEYTELCDEKIASIKEFFGIKE